MDGIGGVETVDNRSIDRLGVVLKSLGNRGTTVLTDGLASSQAERYTIEIVSYVSS